MLHDIPYEVVMEKIVMHAHAVVRNATARWYPQGQNANFSFGSFVKRGVFLEVV